MQGHRLVLLWILGLLPCISGNPCFAQTSAPSSGGVQGSLVDLINSGRYSFDTLQRLAAIANQASYNALTTSPRSGEYCIPTQTGPSASCPPAVYLVFNNLRQLIQTANALLNNGQATRFSLNLNSEGLGDALRWTAAEELSAPGAAATQFTNSQVASVLGRITALRFGASGFSVAGMPMLPGSESATAASQPRALGGGASADSTDIATSRWGGFLNGSYGWGNRSPTVLEDAFTFDSRDATLGIDYRFSRRLVLGATAGYTNQRIDFNSNLSVVGGGIRSNGYSLQAFALYQWDAGPYASVSLGTQRSRYDSTRLITYPSFNIEVASVDATATGSTNSDALTGTFEIGWSLAHKAFAIEPYVSGDYQHLHVGGFHETSVNNAGSNAGQAAGFDFDYAAQRIVFLDSAVGTRLQYTFSPSFGVAVPYVKAEYHHLFDNEPGSVASSYNAIVNTGAGFDIPADKPSPNFFQFAVGSSFVFGHGIQAFVQYQTSAGITNVSSHLISAGVRGAF